MAIVELHPNEHALPNEYHCGDLDDRCTKLIEHSSPELFVAQRLGRGAGERAVGQRGHEPLVLRSKARSTLRGCTDSLKRLRTRSTSLTVAKVGSSLNNSLMNAITSIESL